ncbi:hypothetical protein FRAHR75_1200013 [Frankia sp. Hr75.2]|nr:hypothetical protein FRAHR75_1200013 [Frankia sp. Hr75.2]SQD95433.1 hypothetical protein FMEAI12_3130039 [Parafrankia sp. Ea1.12]
MISCVHVNRRVPGGVHAVSLTALAGVVAHPTPRVPPPAPPARPVAARLEGGRGRGRRTD